ncbi:MAG: type II toxin-antitoxin system HicA family toxin [Planctomycetota bacterium]
MPKKIRELKRMLQKAGFGEMRGRGKGSHSMWRHLGYPDITVELSGNDGADARRYHEGEVEHAIAEVARRNEDSE